VDDSGNGAVIGGLAAKDAVIGGFGGMTDKIDAGSGENDGGGEQDSGAEQVAEDEFDAVIVPGFGAGAAVGRALERRASDFSPQSFVEHLQA
jgi:hypothetical protein